MKDVEMNLDPISEEDSEPISQALSLINYKKFQLLTVTRFTS